MDSRDIPALRGITVLAARPGGSLGPFGSVAALSCELSGLTLHHDGCRWVNLLLTPDSHPAPAVLVGTDAERTDLASVAARLPGWTAADNMTVSWCQDCARSGGGSPHMDVHGRARWLLLATIAGEIEIAEEKVRALANAAGPALTWPHRTWWGRRRSSRRLREHAETLAALVELHRCHPVIGAPALDADPFASLSALLHTNAQPVCDQDVTEFGSALAEVGEAVAAQHRHVQELTRSFPLHRLADQAGSEEVLVLVATHSLAAHWRHRAGPTALAVLAPVVHADAAAVVLQVPRGVVSNLGVRRLGQVPVPSGSPARVKQVAQVAAAASMPLIVSGHGTTDTFASLLAAAVTASDGPVAA